MKKIWQLKGIIPLVIATFLISEIKKSKNMFLMVFSLYFLHLFL